MEGKNYVMGQGGLSRCKLRMLSRGDSKGATERDLNGVFIDRREEAMGTQKGDCCGVAMAKERGSCQKLGRTRGRVIPKTSAYHTPCLHLELASLKLIPEFSAPKLKQNKFLSFFLF